MFVFGAGLYAVATVFAWVLPKDQANSSERLRHGRVEFVKMESSGELELGEAKIGEVENRERNTRSLLI